MIQQEVTQVGNLLVADCIKQRWAGIEQRPDGSVWKNDSVIHLNKIGVARKAKLEKEGINQVRD